MCREHIKDFIENCELVIEETENEIKTKQDECGELGHEFDNDGFCEWCHIASKEK